MRARWVLASPHTSPTRACLLSCWTSLFPASPDRNAAALKGIENALKQRPGGFFTEDKTALIRPGNFEDDLPQIAECDWIIEAIVESLGPKRDLGARWMLTVIQKRSFPLTPAGFLLRRLRKAFLRSFGGNFWEPIFLIRRVTCI